MEAQRWSDPGGATQAGFVALDPAGRAAYLFTDRAGGAAAWARAPAGGRRRPRCRPTRSGLAATGWPRRDPAPRRSRGARRAGPASGQARRRARSARPGRTRPQTCRELSLRPPDAAFACRTFSREGAEAGTARPFPLWRLRERPDSACRYVAFTTTSKGAQFV